MQAVLSIAIAEQKILVTNYNCYAHMFVWLSINVNFETL